MAKGKEIKHITLGLIFSWIIGVGLILSGMGFLISLDIISSIILFVVGAILLPPVDKQIKDKWNIKLSKGIKIAIVIIGIIFAGYMSNDDTKTSTDKPQTQAQEEVTQKEETTIAQQQTTKTQQTEVKKESEPKCTDECSSLSCEGLNFIFCEKVGECYKKVNKGKVVNKCGVECKTDSNCKEGYECKEYKCKKKEKIAQTTTTTATTSETITTETEDSSSGWLDALEDLKESLEQTQTINSKLDECTKACAGDSYGIPVVRDEFYSFCYQIYYYLGEAELDKKIEKCKNQ